MSVMLALAVSACGGGSEPSSGSADDGLPSTTTGPAAAPPAKAPGLANAIRPACGVGTLKKPHVDAQLGDNGGQYWRLVYESPVTAPRIKGAITILTIVEQDPALPRGSLDGGHDVKVAGRSVSLRQGTKKTPSNVAQWKTRKARYIVLADGSLQSLERLIRCFP